MLDYDHNCRDDHITGGRAKIILLWQIVLEVKMEMMDSKIPYITTLKSLTLQKNLTRLNFPFRDFLLLHTLTLQNFYNLTLTPFLTEWKKSLQLKVTFLLFPSTPHFPPEHSVTQPGFGGEADIGKNQDWDWDSQDRVWRPERLTLDKNPSTSIYAKRNQILWKICSGTYI